MTAIADMLAVVDTADLVRELRRRGEPVDDAVVLGDLEVDPVGYVATWRGDAVPLTRREAAVLYLLARCGGSCRSDRLARHVWRGYGLRKGLTNLRTTVCGLRRKLPGLLPTLHNGGWEQGVYRLDVDATAGAVA